MNRILTTYSLAFVLGFLFIGVTSAQTASQKSYIISKSDFYTFDINKNDTPVITLNSEEKKWVGDKEDPVVQGNRIDYSDAFESVYDIEAYSITPENKKIKVRYIDTKDREIENIFYHDQKMKIYYFSDLKNGSETYSYYKKSYYNPHFLDPFYFKDDLECKEAKITLKVSSKIEIGYVLKGRETDKIQFTTQKEGDYTLYTWRLTDSQKVEYFDDGPKLSYYTPHLIFFIKSYVNSAGKQPVVGSVENLYHFYTQTIKDINKADESSLRAQTLELIKGLSSDLDKTKAIFDFVQSKVQYVAFEDGMGGFIPREAADVFQKKYGDCKDMANLLNQMLHVAGIESNIAWIGTRHNNYSYEEVPSPIVDNHMICIANIDKQNYFLDATGQYTIFPSFTPFIQGKQALLKIDDHQYKIIPVPIVASEANQNSGKIKINIDEDKLTGTAQFQMSGFLKTQFLASYKTSVEKDKMLKNYLSRFIVNLTANNFEVKNDDLSRNPVSVSCQFSVDKWIKKVENQLLFKPILFFPFSDSRIDTQIRKVPYMFDFNKSYNFEYEIAIPNGYKLDFKPDDYTMSNDLVKAKIKYKLQDRKIVVSQELELNKLLLETEDFDSWNTIIKSITKQYNQNIILVKE